jgi:putative N6-adenine-specific DNA methylase
LIGLHPKMHIEDSTFFIQVHPGLENLLKNEINHKLGPFLGERELKVLVGGIELNLPTHIGFSLNQVLRVPTRILLRLKSFKCRDFPKLYHHIERIPWHLYLRGHVPEVHATTKESRLMHTGRVAQTIQDGIKRSFEKRPIKKSLYEGASAFPIPEVYIRIDNDTATLSIDTSGEALYKRGSKSRGGAAPLRENLAFSLLYSTALELKEENLTLLDPFSGSGTMLLEAHAFDQFVDTEKRNFSYLGFPSFVKSNEEMPFVKLENPYKKLNGIELDERQFEILNENCKAIANLTKADSLSKNPYGAISNLVIVTNPPYGDRIDEDFRIDEICEKLQKIYSPKAIGFIFPKEKIPKKLKSEMNELFKFNHGGISVGFYFKKA